MVTDLCLSEAGVPNTSESNYNLYIPEADYIFKGPIIYSRGRLYILNGVLSLVNSFTN